jgi:integrase
MTETVRDSKGVARFSVRTPYKRAGSEFWYAKVKDLQTGQLQQVSSKEKSRVKASQALRDLCQERIRATEELPVAAKRFDIAYREFLDLKAVRAVTKATYEIDFDLYKQTFGEKYVSQIRAGDIEAFLKMLLVERKSAARTRGKHLTALRGFFTWAKRHKLCREDPTDGIKIGRGERRKIGIALTLEQARKLLEAAQTPVTRLTKDPDGRKYSQTFRPVSWLFTAIVLGLHTGLRRSSILGLRWRDVDIAARKITVPATLMKAKVEHEIPIHRELATHLRKLLHGRAKVPQNDLVVGVQRTGTSDVFAMAAKRAGCLTKEDKPIGWHDLRRTFATIYGLRVPHPVLQRLLAHAAADVTDLYPKPPFEELLQAVDGFPGFLGSEAPASKLGSSPQFVGVT